MRWLPLLPLLAVACGSSSAGTPATTGPAARTDPAAVHVAGTVFRDGQGRQLLFRGYNAKATTLFDVTFSDGRVPEETFPDLTEAEAARIEQLGWNAIRLPVDWSGLEPHPQQYSDAFLSRLDAVLAMAKQHHFYVLVDMHQDAYSKEIGEDGEPLWAIVPPPTMLLQGPYSDSRRLSSQVLQAGWSFFSNANATDGRPLRDAYAAAVQKIVRHVLGNPAVLGYEAFNEPVPLHLADLLPFHEKLADAVHAIDADAPVLFEPQATRNQSDSAEIPSQPWSHGPAAYAVHVYTCWFSSCTSASWANQDPSLLAPSMAHADQERAGWGTPLFVTEFGCDQTAPQGPAWLSAELDLQDQYLASSTAWVLSENGSWGMNDGSGNERAATARVMARTFPRAVAGTIVKIARPKPGDMVVTYRADARTRGLPNEVSLSSAYVTGAQVLCDGAPVAFTQDVGRATFVCPVSDDAQHTFEVVGTPVQ